MKSQPVSQNSLLPVICREYQKPILVALEVISGLALSGVAVYLLWGINVMGAIGTGAGVLVLTGGFVAITLFCIRKTSTIDRRSTSTDPIIEATVYICTGIAGPISEDNKFNFKERLRDENGNPLNLSPEDIYVTLKFSSLKGDASILYRDAEGIPFSNEIYLPSPLFKGIKEGEKVRFRLDGQLVELTCRQKESPLERNTGTFDYQLGNLISEVMGERKQGLFKQDTTKAHFGSKIAGTIHSCTKFDGNKVDWEDFSFAAEDQKHGEYKEIRILQESSEKLLLEIFIPTKEWRLAIVENERISSPSTKDGTVTVANKVIPVDESYSGESFIQDISKYVAPSDVILAETKGLYGLHQLWIFIPHKLENNCIPPKASDTFTSYDSEGIVSEFTEILSGSGIFNFNSENGDRIGTYFHGRYKCIDIPEGKTYKASLNQNGWLEINFTEKHYYHGN